MVVLMVVVVVVVLSVVGVDEDGKDLSSLRLRGCIYVLSEYLHRGRTV